MLSLPTAKDIPLKKENISGKNVASSFFQFWQIFYVKKKPKKLLPSGSQEDIGV